MRSLGMRVSSRNYSGCFRLKYVDFRRNLVKLIWAVINISLHF